MSDWFDPISNDLLALRLANALKRIPEHADKLERASKDLESAQLLFEKQEHAHRLYPTKAPPPNDRAVQSARRERSRVMGLLDEPFDRVRRLGRYFFERYPGPARDAKVIDGTFPGSDFEREPFAKNDFANDLALIRRTLDSALSQRFEVHNEKDLRVLLSEIMSTKEMSRSVFQRWCDRRVIPTHLVPGQRRRLRIVTRLDLYDIQERIRVWKFNERVRRSKAAKDARQRPVKSTKESKRSR